MARTMRRLIQMVIAAGAAAVVIATGAQTAQAHCAPVTKTYALNLNLGVAKIGPAPYASFPSGPQKSALASTQHIFNIKAGAITADAGGDPTKGTAFAKSQLASASIDFAGFYVAAEAFGAYCNTNGRKVTGGVTLAKATIGFGGFKFTVPVNAPREFGVNVPGFGKVIFNHQVRLPDGGVRVHALDIQTGNLVDSFLKQRLMAQFGVAECHPMKKTPGPKPSPTPGPKPDPGPCLRVPEDLRAEHQHSEWKESVR